MKRKIEIILLLVLIILPVFVSDFRLNLMGKFLTYAIIAVGLDLLWGYTGILSLGHGIYFGFGAYLMAMYLKLESSGSKLPDFMRWSGIRELPDFWEPFQYPVVAIIAAVLIPMIFAALLGYLTFRNRISGVYFTILTEALVIVIVTLFVGQQGYTGGTNGITGFDKIFGFELFSPSTQLILYYLTLVFLIAAYLFASYLVRGRLGDVLIAIRDGENRLRFLGYNAAVFKTFIYVISAGLAGLAGMLFVLQVGIISPTMMAILPSIEMVLWVAIGGRATLIGPVLGAIVINLARTGLSENYPDIWSYFLGILFIVGVIFMPEGLMGLFKQVSKKVRKNTGIKERVVLDE